MRLHQQLFQHNEPTPFTQALVGKCAGGILLIDISKTKKDILKDVHKVLGSLPEIEKRIWVFGYREPDAEQAEGIDKIKSGVDQVQIKSFSLTYEGLLDLTDYDKIARKLEEIASTCREYEQHGFALDQKPKPPSSKCCGK